MKAFGKTRPFQFERTNNVSNVNKYGLQKTRLYFPVINVRQQEKAHRDTARRIYHMGLSTAIAFHFPSQFQRIRGRHRIDRSIEFAKQAIYIASSGFLSYLLSLILVRLIKIF